MAIVHNKHKKCGGSCGGMTPHQIQKPNHLLHLIMSVVTGGLWLIVWLLLTLFSEARWQCTKCGERTCW